MSWLELFFDLVFVVVIARLAHHLAGHVERRGDVRGAVGPAEAVDLEVPGTVQAAHDHRVRRVRGRRARLAIGFSLWWIYFDFVARRVPKPVFVTALFWVYLHLAALTAITVQDGGGERYVTLRCNPASGTHPHPVSACRVLSEAGGDFTKIVGKPGTLCPALSEPVTASASGDYLGGQVLFRRTYLNRCDLARHTGPVFEL